jgi:hypothetical protein
LWSPPPAPRTHDGAKPLLWNLRRAFPVVKLTSAGGGYAGQLVTWANTRLHLATEVVKRPDDLRTFEVLPRRWVVERTFAWISKLPPLSAGLRTPARQPPSDGAVGHDRLMTQRLTPDR